ncbi:MAG: iron-sulfur cluster assembly protein [Bacteroidales bacterium]|jgi:FeS assembly SUF system protein|nr:iron-sulfur cluster assembly protein [Bacteroidales bacterium]MCI2122426.1 iron-sulfur cluster assembly protein [Bacteroidales bacterium]MCI2145005.1 iron-sulfur cluster assembly protein [Bacteroidales bacterium]
MLWNSQKKKPESSGKIDRNKITADIIKGLRTIYDPEIPLNIYDLGLIYELKVDDDGKVHIKMTLTAPGCPMADMLFEQVNEMVSQTSGVKNCAIELVFEPEWDKSRISEEGLAELGML